MGRQQTHTSKCVKLFPSTSDKPVSRSVTPAGSSSASSTESSRTVRCPPIRPSVAATMPSTPSSPRLVLASTSPALSSSISSPLSSMRSVPVPTDSCSTPSNSSPERRMPPTTSPVVTTPLDVRLSTSASTESVSSPISALVSRVSSSSTPLVAVPDPVSDLSSSRDSPSITERNPSSVSPSTPPPRSPPPSLSLTTLSCPLTLSLSTPTSPSCSTTRLFMTSADAISTSRGPPTPTSTDSSPRSSHPSLPPSDSMVPSTLMSLNSRPTLSPTPGSISCCPHTLPLSQLRRRITNNSLLPRSPTPPSSPRP